MWNDADDYSHVIRSVSVSQGKKYTVNSIGMSIVKTNAKKFDSMDYATAT